MGKTSVDCFSPSEVKDHVYTNETHFLGCSPNCKRCLDSKTCLKCERDYLFEDHQCKGCPPGCGSCRSSTQCDVCEELYHYLGTDGYTCGPECGANEFKDEVDGIKRCQICPENCSECDKNGCKKCVSDEFEIQGEVMCVKISKPVEKDENDNKDESGSGAPSFRVKVLILIYINLVFILP